MQTAARQARTINEARTLANIEARAKTLFADGYTYRQSPRSPEFYFVHKPTGNPMDFYTVHVKWGLCDCPAFTHFRNCKHLTAVRNEINAELAMVAEYERNMLDAELSTGCDAE